MSSEQITNGRQAALAPYAINPWAHSCALWTTWTRLWKTLPLAGPARIQFDSLRCRRGCTAGLGGARFLPATVSVPAVPAQPGGDMRTIEALRVGETR
jgi:hypothetical protein